MRTFYHGSSVEACMSIQSGGFRVDLSDTNAGSVLGDGVYLTTTLQKAMTYATTDHRPHGGVVLVLKVDLGRCKELRSRDSMMRTWHQHGYDSAHSGDDVCMPGAMEELCVRDTSRVHVVDVVVANTGRAGRAGYTVPGERLVKR